MLFRSDYTICTIELRECSANANGVPSVSPGLRASRYPGTGSKKRANPEGVESIVPLTLEDETLSGFVPLFATEPRVARGAQPWAEGWNAVGVRRAFILNSGLETADYTD